MHIAVLRPNIKSHTGLDVQNVKSTAWLRPSTAELSHHWNRALDSIQSEIESIFGSCDFKPPTHARDSLAEIQAHENGRFLDDCETVPNPVT